MDSFLYEKNAVIVKTRQGQLRGYGSNGLCIFKGVPYAQARRFHSPEPVAPWDGVREATSYGYVCPLLDMGGRPSGELLVPHRYWVMNEDCQNLNVWTPACDDAKRPVIVWLHGGGYEAGSAIEQLAYEGENMSRLGQVVVVSINHRLNVLGYFDLSDFGPAYADSGNLGTQDIIAALRWVRDNIAAFGGDPDNVTVMGQSGGGAKVTTLLQTPAADGLFHKGINMSGVIGPILADQIGSGRELAEAMMQELGVSDVKGLETVPYEALAAAYRKFYGDFAKAGKYVGGKPHPNESYRGTPDQNGFRTESAGIPLLIGSGYGEFASFAPSDCDKRTLSARESEDLVRRELGAETAQELLPLFRAAYPDRSPADLLNLDFIFRAPEIEYIAQRSALNGCTWSYLFDLDFPLDGGRTPWHCSDIPFAFHNIDLVPSAHAAEGAEQLQEQIFGSVIAFARTGDPNHAALPTWPASQPGTEQTMVFGLHTAARANYDHALIAAILRHRPAFDRYLARHMGQIQH